MSLIDTREIATAKIVMLSNGGASSLNDLSDVNIYDVSNGQVLEFNSTSGKWENKNGYAGLGIGKKKSVSDNTIITDIDLHREPVAGDRLLIYFDTTVQNPTGLTTYNNGTAVTKNLENVSPLYYNAGWNVAEFKNDGLLYNNVWVRVQNVPVINYNAGSGISIDNGTIINTRRGALTGAIDSISSGYAHVLMSGARDTFAAGALIVVQAEVSGSATNLRIQYGSQASDSQDFRFYDTDGETLSLSVSRGNTIIAMIDNTGYRAIVLKVLDIEAQVGEPVRELRKLKIDGVVYDTDGMRTYEASNVANNNISLSVINAYQFVQKVIAINTGAHSGSSSAWNLVISDGMEVANVALKNADGTAFADDIHENELLFVYVDTAGNIARVLEIHSHDVEILKDICITEKTVSGNPITVTDALPYPAVSLSAEIEASQDLHGLPFPYVGGAYKNKLPMTVASIKAANPSGTWSGNAYTLNGVTFTIQTDADGNVIGIKANGTASANTSFIMYNSSDVPSNIKGQSIILTGCPVRTGNPYTVMLNSWGTAPAIYDNGTEHGTATFPTNPNGMRCDIEIYNGSVLSNVMFYPMIRLSTESDASFAPYSNICPISGRTEANVDDVGKNRWNIPYIRSKVSQYTHNGITYNLNADGTVDISTGTVSASESIFPNAVPSVITEAEISNSYDFKPNTTYTVSFGIPLSSTCHGQVYVKATSTSGWSIVANVSSGTEFNFTTLSSFYQYWVRLQILGNGTSVPAMTIKPMIRPASVSDATFEPYRETVSVTIQLGTTVYGGTLNVTTGVLTVKTALVTYDETSGFAKFDTVAAGTRYVLYQPVSPIAKVTTNNFSDIISNLFKGVTRDPVNLGEIALRASAEPQWLMLVSDKTTIEAFNADIAANNIQVEYPLATPTTLQLTPTQLTMLKGYNRLSSDGGGDMSITYKADRLAAIEAALAAL